MIKQIGGVVTIGLGLVGLYLVLANFNATVEIVKAVSTGTTSTVKTLQARG